MHIAFTIPPVLLICTKRRRTPATMLGPAILWFCSLSICPPALAEEPIAAVQTAEGDTVLEHYAVHYKLQANGQYTADFDIVERALSKNGVAEIGKLLIPYSTHMEDSIIVEAETIKADGRHIPVKAEAIETQKGIIGATSLPDYQVTSVTFPDLAVGDSVHLHRQKTQKQTLFPGLVSIQEQVPDMMAVRDATLTVDARPGMVLQIDAKDVQQLRDETDEQGRHLQWSYSNLRPRPHELAETDAELNMPHVLISNIGSWGELARADAKLMRPKAQSSTAVTALAQSITRAVSDPREQTRLLYDWVRGNIRYIATYIGTGSWEPHTADWVLQNGYGDCKDHVVLLEALLRVIGIDSSPALIHASGDVYRLPGIPYPSFDHAITWVPSLHLYLDSTADSMPFGLLPEMDSDKPTLVIYNDGDPVHRTPMDEPASERIVRLSTLTVHADGSAERNSDVDAFGVAAVVMRDWFHGLGGLGKQHDWAIQQLRIHQLTGQADLVELTDDHNSHVAYRNTQHLDNFLKGEEFGVMPLSAAFTGTKSLDNYLSWFFDAKRSRPGLCAPLQIENTVKVHLDDGIALLHLPRERHWQGDGVNFDQTYAQKGTDIYYHYLFVWAPNHRDCSAVEYQELATIMKKIYSALNAGLPYQRMLDD